MSYSPQETWTELTGWIDYWYQDADIEAIKLCLCASIAHYYPQQKPVWILLIGSAGSGKTELLIQSLRNLPEAHIISKVTPSCFLSGREKGGRKNSLLYRHGDSQLWLFKDFTTFVSMHATERTVVASYLREIWDGEMVAETGSGDTMEWKGKVTTIAVATPAFERHWSALSDLGERFMTVRWRTGDMMAMMKKAGLQDGNEDTIRERLNLLVGELFEGRWQGEMSNPVPSGEFRDNISHLSTITARLRTHVARETGHSRAIIDIPDSESPSRISGSLSKVARTNMDLFHRRTPGPEEYALVRRLAFDTIPQARLTILQTVPHTGEITCGSILYTTRLPRTSLQRQIEELEALNVLEHSTNPGDWSSRPVNITREFRAILDAGNIKLAKGNVIQMPPRRGRKPSSNPDYAQYREDGA